MIRIPRRPPRALLVTLAVLVAVSGLVWAVAGYRYEQHGAEAVRDGDHYVRDTWPELWRPPHQSWPRSGHQAGRTVAIDCKALAARERPGRYESFFERGCLNALNTVRR
ncbi:hypothetical protein [Streptomyces violascens]|uniref:hypothetical protein n=1 Tax=Streptomyces violascens TaxID=67381 RepID=UPI00365552CD